MATPLLQADLQDTMPVVALGSMCRARIIQEVETQQAVCPLLPVAREARVEDAWVMLAAAKVGLVVEAALARVTRAEVVEVAAIAEEMHLLAQVCILCRPGEAQVLWSKTQPLMLLDTTMRETVMYS